MWEELGNLFNQGKQGLDETDMRFAVERLLKEWLKSSEVRCEKVEDGRVVVRVLSPALRQEVLLREAQLKTELKRQYDYRVSKLSVTV